MAGAVVLSARQIPHLSSLTMCFWLRFLKFVDTNGWRMVRYYVRGSWVQELYLMWISKEADRMELVVGQTTRTGEIYSIKDRYETGASVT